VGEKYPDSVAQEEKEAALFSNNKQSAAPGGVAGKFYGNLM